MQPSTTSASSAAHGVRPAHLQAGLDLVGLTQATLAATAITRHPRVIPVVSYDDHARPQDHSTIGRSIGGRDWAHPASRSAASVRKEGR
jgi:hypothetical protein